MRWKQASGLMLAAGVLSGCTTTDDNVFGLRYGPAPVLLAETVQTNTARQAAVIRAVAGMLPTAPARRDEWYSLILAGFNTIDDACMSYVDNLWIMERQKTRNSTILHAAGAVGAALLGAAQPTPSVAAGLIVLSQAFGFAGIVNNAVFDTYLYSQSASTIKRIIRKTTTKYRTVFANNVLATNDEVLYPVASPGAAYHHMREYLSLCLPPTIQAQIDERLNGAKPIAEGADEEVLITRPKTSGANPALEESVAPRAAAPRKVFVRTRRIVPTTSITLE